MIDGRGRSRRSRRSRRSVVVFLVGGVAVLEIGVLIGGGRRRAGGRQLVEHVVEDAGGFPIDLVLPHHVLGVGAEGVERVAGVARRSVHRERVVFVRHLVAVRHRLVLHGAVLAHRRGDLPLEERVDGVGDGVRERWVDPS